MVEEGEGTRFRVFGFGLSRFRENRVSRLARGGFSTILWRYLWNTTVLVLKYQVRPAYLFFVHE